MSKELEAIRILTNWAKFGTNRSGNRQYSIDDLEELLQQALTPPTEQEVCEAIGEHLSPTSYNVKVTEKGISFDYDDNQKTVTTDICIYEDGYLSFVSIDLPPHLITMIGKFYEKEGKE